MALYMHKRLSVCINESMSLGFKILVYKSNSVIHMPIKKKHIGCTYV